MSLKSLSWFALVVALAVTAVFGGLETADHATPVSFGQTYDDGPLLITPRSLSVRSQQPPLPDLPAECRYLVLEVTIENTAERALSLGHPDVTAEWDCPPRPPDQFTRPFEILGVSAAYAGAIRHRGELSFPVAEPGFTEDYALVWLVPAAELATHPEVTVRMHEVNEYVSTFRVDRDWGADPDRYGELRVGDVGAR